jgi:7-cyano-7-deazaguanine synthase
MKAVVLLSGGLDSSTVMAIAKDLGYDLHALTIIYGQRHEKEIESARAVADFIGVKEHRITELPKGLFSGSSLTYDSEIPFERDINNPNGIPSTYVPARNLVFLSIAVSWAEAIDADAIFIGVNEVDYSGYPDCRPEFIDSFGRTQCLATKRGVEGRPIDIKTPIISMTKAEIIKCGIGLNLDYSLTWSCYSGGDKACGRCDSCKFRLNGFEKAGMKDPLPYEEFI